MKGKYLITTDNWFVAPDGREYKAAWGEVEIMEDNILGVKTNRNSVNWYAKVGSENNHIIIAGCQVNGPQLKNRLTIGSCFLAAVTYWCGFRTLNFK